MAIDDVRLSNGACQAPGMYMKIWFIWSAERNSVCVGVFLFNKISNTWLTFLLKLNSSICLPWQFRLLVSICVYLSEVRYLSVVRERFLNDTVWKVSVFGVFLIRFFLHSDRIRRDTPYLSVISPNAGKYGSQKHGIRTLFAYCDLQWLLGLTIKLHLHVAQPCRLFWYKLFISSVSISCEKLGFLVYY